MMKTALDDWCDGILTLTCYCTQHVNRTVRHASLLATTLRDVKTATTITNLSLPPALWTASLLMANATVCVSFLCQQ